MINGVLEGLYAQLL